MLITGPQATALQSLPSLRRRSWGPPLRGRSGNAYIVNRSSLDGLEGWDRAGFPARHDHRFFELVDETIRQEFEYYYLLLENPEGALRGIQPIFVYPQYLLEGITGPLRPFVLRLHRTTPKLLTFRTLMVGSPSGEGVLATTDGDRASCADALEESLLPAARRLRASIIVLKEFPAELRPDLEVFRERGYSRIPSMPYVALDLDFKNFDEYMTRFLSGPVRKDLRRKFRDAAAAPPITLEVTTDISGRVDELYPLYLQVYERSPLHFEKLTPDYLRRLGREIPDRARFFIWTQEGRTIAFNACMLHDDVLWADYLGMDYRSALDLHLYFIVTRDEINWCCRNGIRRYCSGSLNYDPKLHLRFRLLPLDLYVRHVNRWANGVLGRAAPWLTPVNHDRCLRRFPNADEL